MSEVVEGVAVQDKAAAKQAKAEAKRQKKQNRPKVMKWHGLLANQDKNVRVMVFVVIAIIMASLTFTQLGFVGVGLPGSYVAHCVTLLALMALASILFGVPLGSLAGFVAGSILFAHSILQPLDYFETNFINVASSIVLFSLIGFVMSCMFALALRNNPPLWRRLVYILIVCVLASYLFTILFTLLAFIQIVIFYVNTMIEMGIKPDEVDFTVQVFSSVSQLGSLSIQCHVDAGLMLLASYAACAFEHFDRTTKGNRGLRTTFRLWLVVAFVFVFTVATGIGFFVITEQAKVSSRTEMESEIGYLKGQLQVYETRVGILENTLELDAQSAQSLDESEVEGLRDAFSIESILQGYTKESDGTIIISEDGQVVLSNNDAFKEGTSLQTIFERGAITFESSSVLRTPDLMQVTMDEDAMEVGGLIENGVAGNTEEIQQLLERRISTQVAFMLAEDWGRYTIMIIMPDTMVFANRTVVMAWATLLALVLLVAVFLLTSRLLTLVVIRRIDDTNDVLADITDGNLDARVDIRDSREFKSLSTGINTTVKTLKNWIAEAESRMDQELATAKAIQESALPRTFPPFPDIMRFDIYASMNPAKEVGGDFYDFFLIGDDSSAQGGKLGFVVADVSGKGVPAALFMMAAKTEVRNYMESGMLPGEAIDNANKQLCEGNDAGMFVTLFAGVLDYATGHVQYVNAGHNPPLLWQAGSWRWLKDISGMPLGLFEGFPYDTYELDLSIGDELFIYTDGVTEAMNTEGELYGEERLKALLDENFTRHPRRLINTVQRELGLYAQGAVQSDDITMLSFEYGVPPEVTVTIYVKADIEELPNVNEFIHAELDRRLCPMKVQNQLDIALEELFVNVARYAYPDATPENPGHVRISYQYSADPPSVRVEIADQGVPYNPLAKPDAVTPDDIMDVPIGGLGILMAKRSVDEMTYDYDEGFNIVSFKKKW